MAFLKNLEYFTFGEPEKSRSLTEIVEAEYLENGVGVNRRLIKSRIWKTYRLPQT